MKNNEDINDKYHNDISSETNKKYDLMTENFINSIIFGDKPIDNNEVLNLIDSPFLDHNSNDSLSMIYHKFWKNTDIPMALPVFGFLSFVSAFCVFSRAKHQIPFDRPKPLNTWVMALAPSGANKTMSFKLLERLIPTLNGEKVVKPNFTKPDGPKAMVQQLSDSDDGLFFWFEDEASQFFKQVEQIGSPLSAVKEYLLKIKDGDKIDRLNAKEHITAQGTVMTQFFINTIDSMVKSISDDSMHDGLARRYQFVVSDKDHDRDFTDFALYKLNNIHQDENLEKALIKLFSTDINDVTFTFSDSCIKLYEDCFKLFWDKQFSKFMENDKNMYRTYMMESWKYGVFHHILHNQEGTEISGKSLQWGLKVSLFLLNSFQKFIAFRSAPILNNKADIEKRENRIKTIILYIQENDYKKGFGTRAMFRKFNIKKDELTTILTNYKKCNPKFETSLYKKLGIEN